jgi:hypothetical protein
MPINLSQAESELLAGLSEKELDDVRSELHHTQGHEYTESLKEREALVPSLIGKLKP